MTLPETPDELQARLDRERAEYEKAQQDEYGQWVAAQDIHFNGVLAFTAGAQVPASTVARFGYDTHGLVTPAADVERDVEVDAAAEAHLRELAALEEPVPEPEPSPPPKKAAGKASTEKKD